MSEERDASGGARGDGPPFGDGLVRTAERAEPHIVRRGRPDAAAAIWHWRSAESAAPAPDARGIRLRGAARALVAGAIGVLIWLRVSPRGGLLVLIASGVTLAAALISPTGLFRVIEHGATAVATRVARLVHWIVLPALFYGVFLPLGKALRRGRRDRLQRYREPARPSYWSDRVGDRVASASRRRQY